MSGEEERAFEGGTPNTLHPTPYTLHPTPYTLHPSARSTDTDVEVSHSRAVTFFSDYYFSPIFFLFLRYGFLLLRLRFSQITHLGEPDSRLQNLYQVPGCKM